MAGGLELAIARCAGLRFAPLRAAGPWFWVGQDATGWQAGGHEHGFRIAKALRVTFGHQQSVGSQGGGPATGRKESGDRSGLAMGGGRQVSRVRAGLFDPRQRAGTDVASFGHDAIHHGDPGPDAASELSGARGEDDGGALGGAARTVHFAF